MKTVFVVLHYCLPKVTKNCVGSLLALDGDKEIVIVDNASPDGSGVELLQHYKNESKVHIILNKENEGFANGNNRGYLYAKSKLAPDYIVVLNNDTIINNDNFLNILYGIPILLDYHIIAPDIITYKGKHQNPYRMKGVTIKEVLKKRRRKRLSMFFYSLPLLYKLKSKEVVNGQNTYFDKRIYNIVPHGAAVIFTKKWIEREDFAFYPGTFMYYEEDLLYLYVQRKNYKTIYEPNLVVTHLEDMSTDHAHKDVRSRMVFQNKLKIQSLDVIIDFFRNKHVQ